MIQPPPPFGPIQRLRSLFRKRSLRDVFVLVGGTGGGQVVLLMASPLLTRLYTPEDFGLLAVYVGLLSPVLVISSLRFEFAIPLPEESEMAMGLTALGLGLVGAMAAVVGGVVFSAENTIAMLLDVPTLGAVLWLLPFGVLTAGVYQVLNYWAIRTRSFPAIARTKLTQGVGAAAVQVGLGVAGLGPAGLVVGDIAGRASGSSTLLTLLSRSDQWMWSRLSWAGVREAAIRYRRYPSIVAPASLLNALGTHIPALLFAGLYGSQVAGWFALTNRVVAAPVALVGTAVAQVYLERAARAAREEPASLRGLYVSTLKRLLKVGVVPLVVGGGFAPVLFPILFGEVWLEAGWYAAVLSVPFALQFVTAPLNQMLNVIEREDLQLLWNGVRLVLIGGAVLGAYKAGAGAFGAVVTYGIALGLGYLLNIALTLAATRRHLH